MPPRVFVRYDVDNWCFGRIAGWIKRRLSDEFEIVARPGDADPLPEGIDLYVGFNFAALGDYAAVPMHVPILLCVYDHFLWRMPRGLPKMIEAAQATDVMLFGNSRIRDELSAYVGCLPGTWGTCEDGVDTSLFRPAPRPPRQPRDPLLVVGWTGARSSAVKGLDLLRAAANLKWCELRIAAREDRWLPLEEMPAFYHGIDVYCCTSSCEGTPNPILEASACGVPWVSTDVGIVRDLFRSAPSPPGFIVPREQVDVSNALLMLRDDLALRARMGAAGRAAVEAAWTWEKRVEAFRWGIREALKRPPRRTRPARMVA